VKINHESDNRARYYLHANKYYEELVKLPLPKKPKAYRRALADLAIISAALAATSEDVYVNACEIEEGRRVREVRRKAELDGWLDDLAKRDKPSSDVLNTGITSGAVE
jgi:hypothetical protein